MTSPRKHSTRLALRLTTRLLARDWRSGELTVLAVALLVAVSALTAVAFLTDRVQQTVELRAAESLAADLRVASARPIPSDYDRLAQEAGLSTARITSTPSVVFEGDISALASIRAVTEGYPLRGEVRTADRLLQPPEVADSVPQPGEAWASSRLLARLGSDVGTVLEVGATELRVSRVLDFRPDEGFSFVDLAPTLLINEADLAATELVQPGSRVGYRLLLAGERDEINQFKPVLQEALSTGESVRDISDTNPQIRSAMDRAGRFLNLASLVSVLLSAVAVAMAARRYAHRHRDRIALLKCMGARQREILVSSLLQLGVLAIGGGLAGALVGYSAQHGLAFLMRDLIGQTLPLPGLRPAILGLATSVAILAGFALPDLLQMGRTPPLRVLRDDVEPPPLRYGLSTLAAVASLVALLLWMVRDARLVGTIVVGAGATFAALGAAGWLLVRSLQGFRGAAGVAWRYGLANLYRRGRESITQIVAFGLGLMVLLLLTTVRNELMDTWRQSLPANAPNQFLINIQPSEVDAMESFLEERGMNVPRLVPLVRARMTAINGQDVTQMRFEDPQGENWARRDANLSWSEEPQEGNKVIAGEFWPPGGGAGEVSLEQDFAQELSVGIGDDLDFDIAGESVSARVTSIRNVAWDSFKPNFFMVFSPDTLRGYPATHIASLHVAEHQRGDLLDLMREFPGVTAIDLEAVLGQVRDVMDKAALAVQAVFVFTLLAGLTVLWAAVQATRDERRYESAMLRTLGATRRRVLSGVAAEFLAIGLLSGVLAASGASLAGFLVAENLFDLEYRFNPVLWTAGPVLGMLFVGVSGLVATWRVITHSPVSVIRAT